MKRLIILLLFAAFIIPNAAADLTFSVSVDWQLSLQGGVEYQITDYFGLKADLGFSPTGLILADLYAVFDLLPAESPWRVQVLAGIPNAGVPITFSGGMVSFGGALGVGRAVSDKLAIDFYIGEGFPLFFEGEKDIIRDVDFPFGLWPEIVLSLRWL